jgi:outer membrane protein TolC
LNAGIPHVINNIRLAHESNILRYEDAKNQVAILVTKRFYSLIAEQNNLLLLGEIYNLAQRQYVRSGVSFNNGLVGEITLMQSRLSMVNARYNFNAASTSYINNIHEFFAMLGISYNPDIELIGEVDIVKIDADAEHLIRENLNTRPDIVRGRQEIERLQNVQRQTTLQNRAPNLNLSVDWNNSISPGGSDSITASARLSIPIDPWIPGTSREQTISRTGDTIERARLDLTMSEDAAKTQIRSLCALLRNSWDGILIARLSLDTARRSYELTEQGFLNGTVEALTLEDVRNNMANARQRLLMTELSYFNMILDLSAAVNIDWKNLINNFGVTGE